MGDRHCGVQGQEVLASPGQHALWFANAMVHTDARVYTEVVVEWPKAVDAVALRHALNLCQQAHAMLRATLQRLPWGAIALRPDTANAIRLDPLPQWQRWRDQPDFSLETESGIRAWCGGSRMVLALHRIVADGVSVDQIVRELMAHLTQPAKGGDPEGAAHDVMDYVVAQRKAWEAGGLEEHLHYWLEKLQMPTAPLELPWEHGPAVGPLVPTETAQIWISGRALQAWQACCAAAGWHLPQLLRAGVVQWLSRWAAQSSVRLAAVVDARGPHMQGMVGPWEDVRVTCVDVQAQHTLAHLVDAIRAQDARDAEHAAIPFEWVLQQLNSDGMHAQVLPYQVAFEWRDQPERYAAETTGGQVQMRREQTLRADLVLSAQPAHGGGLCIGLRYPPSLLSRERALDALHRWLALLEQGLAQPQRAVNTLPWVSAQELERLSAPWPAPDYRPQPVHQQMLALLAEHGERPAVQCGNEVLTHAELHARAQCLAERLTQVGAGSEVVVAVAMERSASLLVVLLAVWKAGAAFLPLDPHYPAPRIQHMLTDSGAHCLLTDAALVETLAKVCAGLPVADRLWAWDAPVWPAPGGSLIVESQSTACRTDACMPHHLAYVIYTSGSTGLPKGVAVEHGPLSLHCQATAHLYGMSCESRELHFLSISFDGALERWVVPLLVGGCVVLRPPALWTAAQTLQAMQDMQVNNAGFPTSYLQTLAQWAQDHPADRRLRLLSFGGEGMPRATFEQVQRALAPDWLINGYGPTEAVISPLAWKVPAGATFDSAYAPVGRAVGPRRAYVLDALMQPVPPGVAGELYIGGACLARGYHGQPAATAERFVPDPFAGADGARMYRTGDRARWRTDGVVEYLGRVDQQVKVRGYRVELGEVESALRSLHGVADGAAALKGQRLVGYVVPAPGAEVNPNTLRTQLLQSLPEFMVPSVVVAVPALPLTPAGKMDRNALPEPTQVPRKVEPASTALEQTLLGLWQEVLKTPMVGVTDNFFDLGGDSLSALGLLSLLDGAVPGHGLGMADLFHHTDIRSLARAIEAQDDRETAAQVWQDVVHLQQPTAPSLTAPVLYCFPGLLVSTREYLGLVRALGPDQIAVGFVCHSLSAADAAAQSGVQDAQASDGTAVEFLARRYADYILMHSQGRAVVLLGWSWGGVLALETARLLEDQVPVRFVGMLDVCALDAEFAVGGESPMDPAVRARMQADIEAWMPQSRMQAQWQQLLQRMDATVYTQFLHYVNNSPETLPLDGPAVGSREHIFWTLMDNALVFRNYTMRPLDCPIHVWIAQDSLLRAMNVIDWNDYSSRVERVQVIHGATHLSIVNDPRFHQSFAASLLEVSSVATPATPA